MKKYRLTCISTAHDCWVLSDPDGYWIGPGLGTFRSAADALDYLAVYLEREARWLRNRRTTRT